MTEEAQFIVDAYYVRTSEIRVLQRKDTWDIEQRWANQTWGGKDLWRKIEVIEEPEEAAPYSEEPTQ